MGRKKFNDTLQDVIALIAYTDPESCPMSLYMSQARRVEVADQLNNYILCKGYLRLFK